MKCPICKKPVKLEDPESPFCSERCRLLDFDNWANERYVISTPAPSVQEDPDGQEDE